jgi:glycogen synthase
MDLYHRSPLYLYTFMKRSATFLIYNFAWQGNHRYLKLLYENFLDLWIFSEVHGKQYRTVCGMTLAEY